MPDMGGRVGGASIRAGAISAALVTLVVAAEPSVLRR